MTESRTRKAVLQEFRTSELLAAARSVFSRKGFYNATIDDIAYEAGVAKGTVYLYFKSKNDIYIAALRDGIEGLIRDMRRQAEAGGTTETKLHRLIAAKLAFFDKHRDFFQILQSELGRVEKTMTECKDLYFDQAQIVEKVLRQGIKEGVLRKINTKKTAFAVTDLTRGIVIQRVFGWSRTPLDDEVEFIFTLLWKGIAK
jgi:TetR/AcrR family fatty acid metabolism transcriptional regulator